MTAPLQTLESPQDVAGQSLAASPCSPLVAALFVQPDGCYSKLPMANDGMNDDGDDDDYSPNEPGHDDDGCPTT